MNPPPADKCRMSKGCILPAVSFCVERSILKKAWAKRIHPSTFCGSAVF